MTCTGMMDKSATNCVISISGHTVKLRTREKEANLAGWQKLENTQESWAKFLLPQSRATCRRVFIRIRFLTMPSTGMALTTTVVTDNKILLTTESLLHRVYYGLTNGRFQFRREYFNDSKFHVKSRCGINRIVLNVRAFYAFMNRCEIKFGIWIERAVKRRYFFHDPPPASSCYTVCTNMQMHNN